MTTADWYRWEGEDLRLRVQVRPRAGRDEITGPAGGRLKVRITAPPVEGRANRHLTAFLARQFGVAKSRVRLEQGEKGRAKTFLIEAPRRLPEASGIRRP